MIHYSAWLLIVVRHVCELLYFIYFMYCTLQSTHHLQIVEFHCSFSNCPCWQAKAWVGLSVVWLFFFPLSFCMSVCMSVSPHTKRKKVWAIDTKVDRHILHGSCLACIEYPEVGRAKDKVTGLRSALTAWVCKSIHLHVFLLQVNVEENMLQWRRRHRWLVET